MLLKEWFSSGSGGLCERWTCIMVGGECIMDCWLVLSELGWFAVGRIGGWKGGVEQLWWSNMVGDDRS